MSLIRHSNHDGEIRKIFYKKLMPIATIKRYQSFFAAKPDANLASYYTLRARRCVSKADFEDASYESCEALEKALADFWTGQGHPELAELAPSFAGLAGKLAAKEVPSEDVSPLIYAMF